MTDTGRDCGGRTEARQASAGLPILLRASWTQLILSLRFSWPAPSLFREAVPVGEDDDLYAIA